MLPNTHQTNVSENMSSTRADRATWGIALVICVLLAEGILACGACDLTRGILDLWFTNLLNNVIVALGVMLGIIAIFLAADAALAIRWLVRHVHFQKMSFRI